MLRLLRRFAKFVLRRFNTLVDQVMPDVHESLETPTEMLMRRAVAFGLELLANVLAGHRWLHHDVAQTIYNDLTRMSGHLWTTHPPGANA